MNVFNKIKIAYFAFFIFAGVPTMLAVVLTPFQNWDALTRNSSDIVIVRCTKTTNPYQPDTNGVTEEIVDGLVNSDLEIKQILKGTQRPIKCVVSSRSWLRQGESYLIFAHAAFEGGYQAYEPYRIIPLGLHFSTNMLNSKSLDGQIDAILDYRLKALNKNLREEEEEKQRLELRVKK